MLHEIDSANIPRVNAEHIFYALDTPQSNQYLETDKTINYNNLLEYLVEEPERTHAIITNLLENKHRHNLVLSSRNAHLDELISILDKHGIKSRLLIGTSKVAEREQAINDFKEGKAFLIF